MSDFVTVIAGVSSGAASGAVSVPVLASGLVSSLGSELQFPLSEISASIASGASGMTNANVITDRAFVDTISGESNLLEFTDTDSIGATASGAFSGSVSVSSGYSTVIAQAPGSYSIDGAGAGTVAAGGFGYSFGTLYILGAQSNVDLTTSSIAGSYILGVGGNDTLNLYGPPVTLNGADTLNPQDFGIAAFTGGNDRVRALSGINVVEATGNASVFVGVPTGSAGQIEFLNASSVAGTVIGGAGSATVIGGNGGGIFFGGTSGKNLLIGGKGGNTLVGGGNGDTLEAGGSGPSIGGGIFSITGVSTNDLFAGTGNETLLAGSTSGGNMFVAGSGTDIVSTSGAGNQYFFGGTGSATMTGSANLTVAGAKNVYFFGQAGGASGGNDLITNFSSTSSALWVTNGNDITTITSTTVNGASGALVTLSDGTRITLMGVNASGIQQYQGGRYIG
ncbi:MAG TPA: hypothetical protein VF286_08945 [Acidiphilium sp.]